ncbi:hypothetical protein BY458DRAFT_587989 [Sporodiniella umbellata]|nr:hypothetical protein BY458DRAFT_587989 [Sporodiniella umbellata]
MKSLCIQIAGNQGEITETRLKNDGLYISKKIGSLRIPSSPADLKVLRVLLERLDEVKRNAIHISNVHTMIQKDMVLKNNSMDKKRGYDISPNRNDKSKEKRARESNEYMYSSWTRGSWFAPSKSRDIAFAGDLPNSSDSLKQEKAANQITAAGAKDSGDTSPNAQNVDKDLAVGGDTNETTTGKPQPTTTESKTTKSPAPVVPTTTDAKDTSTPSPEPSTTAPTHTTTQEPKTSSLVQTTQATTSSIEQIALSTVAPLPASSSSSAHVITQHSSTPLISSVSAMVSTGAPSSITSALPSSTIAAIATTTPEDNGNKTALIGGIVGAIAGIAVIGAFALLMIRRRKRRLEHSRARKTVDDIFSPDGGKPTQNTNYNYASEQGYNVPASPAMTYVAGQQGNSHEHYSDSPHQAYSQTVYPQEYQENYNGMAAGMGPAMLSPYTDEKNYHEAKPNEHDPNELAYNDQYHSNQYYSSNQSEHFNNQQLHQDPNQPTYHDVNYQNHEHPHNLGYQEQYYDPNAPYQQTQGYYHIEQQTQHAPYNLPLDLGHNQLDIGHNQTVRPNQLYNYK